MDFPLFYMDFIGNRMLMAVIAIIHVMINHPLAVGAYPLVVLLEWWARKTNNPGLDQLAYKITFVLFVITTSLGALTGVGIWLSAALIAPFGIGTLLRVFFWAWFFEWIVFVSEVVLIMIYFLMWKRWHEGWKKKLHIGVGVALSAFSWVTMVIIVAVLGFMMGTGTWVQDQSFLSAIFNPLYFPQLAFRTAFAMLTAGLMAWFMTFFFTRKDPDVRQKAVRFIGIWNLCWAPFLIAAGAWYWNVVPSVMRANVNVALLTQKFMNWQETFAIILTAAVGVIVLVAIVATLRPRLIKGWVLVIPFVLGLYLLGHFERVREFIRKPHVVADYMYSNGVTMTELPVFQRDGILRYATYAKHNRVTEANKIEAGKDVYMLACSRCHTTSGINNVLNKFSNMYGAGQWNAEAMSAFLATMHNSRTYMPPFPGNDAEAEALVAFLQDLRTTHRPVRGAQTGGIAVPVAQNTPAANP